MPGSEFRLLPRLPLEFRTYKIVSPGKLGVALTRGWTPVASVNFEHAEKDRAFKLTRFLIGKGVKRKAKRPRGPTPVIMFPPPEPEPDPSPHAQDAVNELLTKIAHMSPKEVLAFHQEVRVVRGLVDIQESKDVEPPSADVVKEAMDELTEADTQGNDN
jgi:hypothetical protein